MGFFKSLNDLNKQGKEMQKNSDPGQRLVKSCPTVENRRTLAKRI